MVIESSSKVVSCPWLSGVILYYGYLFLAPPLGLDFTRQTRFIVTLFLLYFDGEVSLHRAVAPYHYRGPFVVLPYLFRPVRSVLYLFFRGLSLQDTLQGGPGCHIAFVTLLLERA